MTHTHPQNKLYLRLFSCGPLPSHDLQPFCIITANQEKRFNQLLGCITDIAGWWYLSKIGFVFHSLFWKGNILGHYSRRLDLSLCSHLHPCEQIRWTVAWKLVMQQIFHQYFAGPKEPKTETLWTHSLWAVHFNVLVCFRNVFENFPRSHTVRHI